MDIVIKNAILKKENEFLKRKNKESVLIENGKVKGEGWERCQVEFTFPQKMELKISQFTDAIDYPFSSCKCYETGEDSQGLEILNLL